MIIHIEQSQCIEFFLIIDIRTIHHVLSIIGFKDVVRAIGYVFM